MSDRHFLQRSSGEVVLEKQIDAGASSVTTSDFFPPIRVGIQRLPVFQVDRLLIRFFPACATQNSVLDQVGWQQRSPASIEGLEDHLAVVLALNVDDYNVQALGERGLQLFCAFTKPVLLALKKLSNLIVEISVSLGQSRRRLFPWLFAVDGGFITHHHGLKRVSVAVSRPDFESLPRLTDVTVSISH